MNSSEWHLTHQDSRPYTVVVGAGAVGITLARALEASGVHDVIVLEAGGDVPENSAPEFFAAPSVGQEYDTAGTRYRGLGGATNLWAGWCKPFDAEEWESGALHGSGQSWPFHSHELERWYRVAAKDLALGEWDWNADSVARSQGKTSLAMTPMTRGLLESVLWRFAAEPRSLAVRFSSFINSGRTAFVLNAPVTRLDIHNGRIRSLQFCLESGESRTVICERVILAAGGLENVRLLLAAQEQLQVDGIALDRSGWLGRGWQEHPHMAIGGVLIPQGVAEGSLWLHSQRRRCSGVEVLAGFKVPRASRQGRSKLPVSVTLEDLYQTELDPMAHGLQELLESTTGETSIQRVLYARSEAKTLPQSEIRLGDTHDASGRRQLVLDWRLHVHDIENLIQTGRHLAHAFARLGLGVVHSNVTSTQIRREVIGGAHHIGGARMSVDSKQGVTTPFGAIHGVPNLFVTGSAIFPSGGYSNPTLTILALAHRLADYLITSSGCRP